MNKQMYLVLLIGMISAVVLIFSLLGVEPPLSLLLELTTGRV